MKKKTEKIAGYTQNKIPTGIPLFDEIVRGGLPRGSLSLVFGGAGSGKTVFSIETLIMGATKWNEPGIFVSFEENPKTIRLAAQGFGWNLPELERRGKIFLFDARLTPETLQAGTFDLRGLLAGLEAKAIEIGARRIVFDALDVLLYLLNDGNRERQEIYRISDWLSEADQTGLMTIRSDLMGLPSPRYEYILFLADCVISLQHTVEDQATLRTVRIVKYRTSDFEGNPFPFVIGPRGIEISSFFWKRDKRIPYAKERISTGIGRLDTMLAGGYLRGTSIMITGAPGASKSNLCGVFTQACCRRGERVVYVSFNEFPEEIAGNLSSIGVNLEPYLKSGVLRVYAERPKSTSVEEHLLRIFELVESSRARHIVVDPVSSLLKAGSASITMPAAERLLYFAKERGITTLCISPSFAGENYSEVESVPRDFATLVDTWIHLSYSICGGERNRAITIVKSRGTRHSNQVRELVVSDEGVTLTDVYAAAGEVLMGTLRREKEMDEQAERDRLRALYEQHLLEIKAEEADLLGKLEASKSHLEAKRAQINSLIAQQKELEVRWTSRKTEIQELRGKDKTRPGITSEKKGKKVK